MPSPHDSLRASARNRDIAVSSPYLSDIRRMNSLRSAASQRESSDFDPGSVWGNLEVDYADVARRQADAEAAAQHHALLEEARLHQLTLEKEEEMARAETERRERLEREQELDRMEMERQTRARIAKEEEMRRNPEYLESIRRHAQEQAMSMAVQWPAPLDANGLGLSEQHDDVWNLEALKATLRPEEGPLDDPLSRSSRSRHDSPFDSRNHAMADMIPNKLLLDKLPPVFSEDHNDYGGNYIASEAGSLYRDLCFDLFHTLTVLYEYDMKLSTNLQNQWIKRLRSYYEHVKWKEYDVINLQDGWMHLFRLLLVIEPQRNHYKVKQFINVIQRAMEIFSITLKKMNPAYIRPKIRDTSIGSFEGHILHKILDCHERLTNAFFNGLSQALLQRQKAIFTWMQATYEQNLRDQPREMQRIRQHTAKIIEARPRYFAEHPDDEKVKFLRFVAFGDFCIRYNRDFALKWINALRELPEEALSSMSELWETATNIAGVYSSHSFSGKSFSVHRPVHGFH
jgi:hypothetical protein